MFHLRIIKPVTLAILAAFPGVAAAASFQCKLWLVPNQGGALQAVLPAPSLTPDVTFTTEHIAFFSSAPLNNNVPEVNYTVFGFLNSENPVTNLTYSGRWNVAVGARVNGSTPEVNSSSTGIGTYGPYMSCTGVMSLVQGEPIDIAHDDGVSLYIDGVRVAGFSAPTPAYESVLFSGQTGRHTIQIVYVNLFGAGVLAFVPNM